jgi:hypothetical protein
MRRLAVVIACGIALALPMAGQGIAGADTWGGCSGNTCTVGIDKIANIIFTEGDKVLTPDLSNLNVNVPACWLAPTFTQADLVALLPVLAKDTAGAPPAQLQQLQQYIHEVTSNTSTNGMWWTGEYLDTPAGNACVNSLPLWLWVPAGQTPPPQDLPITPFQLAELAEAVLQVPPLTLTLNPAAKTYVNLPTFVQFGNTQAITVTATIQGYLTVSVTAVPLPQNTQILPGTTAATPYTTACGAQGSHLTQQEMAQAGPGSQPDCGVVYQAASTSAPQGYTLQVSLPWTVTWIGGDQPLPPPYPNQVATVQVPVAEIQSLNNTGP